MTGTQLGHYTIEEKLGEGGMGVVCKARDTRLLRPVAIKILPPHLIADENIRLRFIQEARAASVLNHPNICTVYDIGESENSHYIVMELIEGETLRDVLYRHGRLSEAEVVNIALQICDALEAAHKKNLVQRDIKPENIMLTDDRRVKVLDFGLAKLATEIAETSFEKSSSSDLWKGYARDESSSWSSIYATTLSSFLGTPAYMSPEQIEQANIDERTDIFSLGIVLYELLTGVRPFDGQDDALLMKAIVVDNPLICFDQDDRFSPELGAALNRSLAKSPKKRQQSVSHLRKQIRALVAGDEKQSSQSNARSIVFGALALLVFAAIVLTLALKTPFFDSPQRSDESPPLLQVRSLGLSTEMEGHPIFFKDGNSIIYKSSKYSGDYWRDPKVTVLDLNYGTQRNLALSLRSDTLMNISISDVSTKGNRIVYSMGKHSPFETKVFLVDTSVGIPQKISDLGYGPKWSPDDRLIAYSTTVYGNIAAKNEVFIYDSFSGKVEKISPDNGLNFAFPDWSPDGKWIVCTGGKGSRHELWLIEIATGIARQISEFGGWATHPVWVAEDSQLYFLVTLDSYPVLYRGEIDTQRGNFISEPKQVLAGHNISDMDVSPKGDRLVFTKSGRESEIVRVPLSGASVNSWQEAETIFGHSEGIGDLDISPDGSQMAIEAYPGGRQSLIVYSLEDSSELVLYQAQPAYAPCWSHDGKWIAFDAGGGDQADIWRIPSAGGQPEKLIEHPGADWMPTYSPDGKHICFISNRSGEFDLWVQHLISNESFRITHSTTRESRGTWSQDGTRIAFFQETASEGGAALRLYDLRSDATEEIVLLEDIIFEIFLIPVWSEDNNSIFFRNAARISEVSLTTREVSYPMGADDQNKLINTILAAKENYLYIVPYKTTSDLWMAEGLR